MDPDNSLVVDGEFIVCPDGQRIRLDDLRAVTAPRILMGVDPSLQSGSVRSGDLPGAVVVLKYQHPGVKGPPQVKLVSVTSFDEADQIVLQLQHAKRSARGTAGAGRVVAGRCESCGRELRVKAGALRPAMRLTCKCGYLNLVQGPAAIENSGR